MVGPHAAADGKTTSATPITEVGFIVINAFRRAEKVNEIAVKELAGKTGQRATGVGILSLIRALRCLLRKRSGW